jgi:hypothetical protein
VAVLTFHHVELRRKLPPNTKNNYQNTQWDVCSLSLHLRALAACRESGKFDELPIEELFCSLCSVVLALPAPAGGDGDDREMDGGTIARGSPGRVNPLLYLQRKADMSGGSIWQHQDPFRN